MMNFDMSINNPIRLGMEDEDLEQRVYACIDDYENIYHGHPVDDEFWDVMENHGIEASELPNCYWNMIEKYA